MARSTRQARNGGDNISDAFEEQHGEAVPQKAKGAGPEDPDDYRAQSIFRVSCHSRQNSLP